jgi:hypothetical protein
MEKALNPVILCVKVSVYPILNSSLQFSNLFYNEIIFFIMLL